LAKGKLRRWVADTGRFCGLRKKTGGLEVVENDGEDSDFDDNGEDESDCVSPTMGAM
jgi:hypothetical protein